MTTCIALPEMFVSPYGELLTQDEVDERALRCECGCGDCDYCGNASYGVLRAILVAYE